MRDPYEVLSVSKGADIKDVKKAYRKLARDLHPDLHPGDPRVEDRFKEVAAAYDFLSDPNKKAPYDRGEIDASGSPRAGRTFYRTYTQGGHPGSRQHDPQEAFNDLDGTDIFSELFRGRRRTSNWRAAKRQGDDIRHQLTLDFEDAVKGTTKEIVLTNGNRVKLTIPVGSEDGQVLRLRGKGMPGVGGGPAGDVRVELRIKPHRTFTRAGKDIHSDVPVTLQEAVLGAKIEVPTIDGPVTLTIPKGSNTGTRLRLKGRGAQTQGHDSRGDQYVALKIMLPEEPDPDLIKLVEEWAAAHPYRVRSEP
jgi:DnaJ-class molecular chaperone